jgi:putative oxidoreductase
MTRKLFQTPADSAAALARLGLGLVMFPHGAQHLFGWFGGYGFAGMIRYFSGLGIPPALGALAVLTEFFGSLALIFGLGGRLAALGILSVMTVAAIRVHLPNGFFMNWLGNQKGEGFEYQLLAIALALVVVLRGSGSGSIDRWITRPS